jgi:hypothetical protein
MKTPIQRIFASLKVILPRFVWMKVRAVSTAVITPVVFSRSTGHFKSSLKGKAMTRHGEPLPWYTYSCIDLLKHRNYSGRSVLEFGAGQSTLWWASCADHVVSIEGDPVWHAEISKCLPENVQLHLAPTDSKERHLEAIKEILLSYGEAKFDIVVIDDVYREDLVSVAFEVVKANGAIICDDAESYGFYETTKNLDVARVDFFGYAPGVVLPRCTSIYFRGECFLFEPTNPIFDMAYEL